MIPSRRDVIRLGAFGAGTLLLPRASFPAAAPSPDAGPAFFPAGGSERRRRFLLHVRCPPAVDDQGREDPELSRQGARSLDWQERRHDARHLADQAARAVPRPLQRAQRRVHGAELRRPSAEHELPVRWQAVRRRFLRPASQLRRDRPQPGIARRHHSHRIPCSSTSTTIRALSPLRPNSLKALLRRCAMPSLPRPTTDRPVHAQPADGPCAARGASRPAPA